MTFIIYFLKKSWGVVSLAMLAGVASGASGAAIIVVMNSALADTSRTTDALWWQFAVLAATVVAARAGAQLALSSLAQRTIFDIQTRLCRKVLSTPLRAFEEIGPHRVLTTLTNDTETISRALLHLPMLAMDGVTIAMSLAYLAWLSPLVFVCMLAILGLGIALNQLFFARAEHLMRTTRDEQDQLMKHFQSLTGGIKELKLHGLRRRHFLSELLDATAQSLRRQNVRTAALFSAGGSSGQLLFYGFLGFLLFGAPSLQMLAPGVASGYVLTVLYLMGPIGGFFGALPNIGRARVSLAKIESLGLSLDNAREPGDALESPAQPVGFERIDLVGVTHTYRQEDGTAFTLGPVDLQFHAGEIVFLVGGNGSGKTTLAKLICGLYAPESGAILLDGVAVSDEKREAYRQHFSAVFSDFFLFEALLGLRGADLDAEARTLLDVLHLGAKVDVSNETLSTVQLSAGQRKRLALLIAFLEDRPFYVFDEWAADQDPLFKGVFYNELLQRLKNRGKTVLVISHDDRYFHLGDRIVKLDYGTLAIPEPEPHAAIADVAVGVAAQNKPA